MRRRTRSALARYTPAGLVIALMILSVVPWRLALLSSLLPALLLPTMADVLLFRPALLPYPFLFAAGLISDGLTGTPPGVTSCTWIMLGIFSAIARRRIIPGVFLSAWGACAVAVFLALALKWGLIAYAQSAAPPLESVLMHWAFATAAFPACHYALRKLYRRPGSIKR